MGAGHRGRGEGDDASASAGLTSGAARGVASLERRPPITARVVHGDDELGVPVDFFMFVMENWRWRGCMLLLSRWKTFSMGGMNNLLMGGGSIGEDDTILFLLAVGCVGLCCGRSSGPATRIYSVSHTLVTTP